MKKAEFLTGLSALNAAMGTAIDAGDFAKAKATKAQIDALQAEFAKTAETSVDWDAIQGEISAKVETANKGLETQLDKLIQACRTLSPGIEALGKAQKERVREILAGYDERVTKRASVSTAFVDTSNGLVGHFPRPISITLAKRAKRERRVDANGVPVPKASFYRVRPGVKPLEGQEKVLAALQQAEKTHGKLTNAIIGEALFPLGVKGKDDKPRPHFKLSGKGAEGFANLVEPVVNGKDKPA